MPDEPDVQKAIDKMINIIEVDVEVDPEQEVTPSALVVSMRHKRSSHSHGDDSR